MNVKRFKLIVIIAFIATFTLTIVSCDIADDPDSTTEPVAEEMLITVEVVDEEGDDLKEATVTIKDKEGYEVVQDEYTEDLGYVFEDIELIDGDTYTAKAEQEGYRDVEKDFAAENNLKFEIALEEEIPKDAYFSFTADADDEVMQGESFDISIDEFEDKTGDEIKADYFDEDEEVTVEIDDESATAEVDLSDEDPEAILTVGPGEEFNIDTVDIDADKDVDVDVIVDDVSATDTLEIIALIELEVIETDPDDGEEDLAVDTEIKITFNKEINILNIDEVSINGGFSYWIENGKILVLDSDDGFDYETEYTVTIGEDAVAYADDAEIKLAEDYELSFTTEEEKDGATEVSLTGDKDIEADGEKAEGEYTATLDEEVEADVTFTLDTFEEANIDSVSEGEISELVNHGIVITADADGEAGLDIIFASDVEDTGTLEASIDEDDDLVAESDSNTLDIDVDTTEVETGFISGEVNVLDQDGEPYEEAEVEITVTAENNETYAETINAADDDGESSYEYILKDVESDNYTVFASAEDFEDSEEVTVAVETGEVVEDIDLELILKTYEAVVKITGIADEVHLDHFTLDVTNNDEIDNLIEDYDYFDGFEAELEDGIWTLTGSAPKTIPAVLELTIDNDEINEGYYEEDEDEVILDEQKLSVDNQEVEFELDWNALTTDVEGTVELFDADYIIDEDENEKVVVGIEAKDEDNEMVATDSVIIDEEAPAQGDYTLEGLDVGEGYTIEAFVVTDADEYDEINEETSPRIVDQTGSFTVGPEDYNINKLKAEPDEKDFTVSANDHLMIEEEFVGDLSVSKTNH